VEIVGLLKSALRWLAEMYEDGLYAHKGVSLELARQNHLSWVDWGHLIEASFEKHFYVPLDPAEDHKYSIESGIVHRRGIYKVWKGEVAFSVFADLLRKKDSFGSTRRYTDYQLRPNFR